MVKTLSQIVATILSVEAAFMAAFLVFLFTSQASLDEQIKEEGLQIARILRDPPTTKLSVFADGYKLLEKYKERYPKESQSRISLLNSMVKRIILSSVVGKPPAQSSLENKISTFPEIGRAYIWIIEEYMECLSGNMYIHFAGSLGEGDVESKFNYKEEAFPYGLKDTVKWSNEFIVIMNAYGILSTPFKKDHYLSTFEKYLQQPEINKFVKDINYRQWMQETKEWFDKIENHNSKVQSFLTLKELNSVKMRLPHLRQINFYMILSLLVGVIYPLFLLSGGNREDDFSKATNRAILLLVICLLTAGFYFLIIDIHGYFTI
ncbi:MAG: hypothetical protein AB1306_09720 [Nitrospirota bacterium]